MASVTTSFIKAQLKRLQNAADDESIPAERRLQDFMGTVLQKISPGDYLTQEAYFEGFRAAMLSPVAPDLPGAVMYLHGGGYCCGDLEYAKGFGTVLAVQANSRVFCPAYRLAPEYPYPAALIDAVASYRYLIKTFPAEKIVVIGESAGGGLLFSLCLKLKEEGLPLPGGLVAMSPWTDLTSSGASYRENQHIDPSMTLAHLGRFASYYSPDQSAWTDPFISPLFGDLSGLPESLVFVGGDEIMRDDAVMLYEKLTAAGCKSRLTVAPEMWHAYPLYCRKERQEDLDEICAFIRRITK